MGKSNEKNKLKLGIFLILLAASLSSLGQLVWKFGADANGSTSFKFYMLGFLFAGLGMFFMMIAFHEGPVSTLQPMMSIGFALSIFIGRIFLNEPITWKKLIGITLIIIGSILLVVERNEEMY